MNESYEGKYKILKLKYQLLKKNQKQLENVIDLLQNVSFDSESEEYIAPIYMGTKFRPNNYID